MTHPFIKQLQENSHHTSNHICLGLDPDITKLPNKYTKDISGVNNFLKNVIQETTKNSSLSITAIKPNISFFEAMGIEGLQLLKDIRREIPSHIPVIIDGKRGDIGNTSRMQAQFIFDVLGADASTLHPYMGDDSLIPFFEYTDKFNFVLALTSNPGANRFEKLSLSKTEYGQTLSEYVLKSVSEWNKTYHNVGAVVGATHDEIAALRTIDPSISFLIPGVGAQGGDYTTSVENGLDSNGVVLVNMSRSLLYASKNDNHIDIMLEKIQEFSRH